MTKISETPEYQKLSVGWQRFAFGLSKSALKSISEMDPDDQSALLEKYLKIHDLAERGDMLRRMFGSTQRRPTPGEEQEMLNALVKRKPRKFETTQQVDNALAEAQGKAELLMQSLQRLSIDGLIANTGARRKTIAPCQTIISTLNWMRMRLKDANEPTQGD